MILNDLMRAHRVSLQNAAVCELELISILAKQTTDKENRRRLCRGMIKLESVIAQLRNDLGMVNEPV